ncbi:ATP-binding protein [Streptomyces sp. NPDC051776]|uniref:ATP-binding protein n=1 Tax=Streptomyces sp. NPDC051776 TaxID=3155414 RepID=UPI003420C487
MAVQLNTMRREAAEHICPLPHVPQSVSAVRRHVRTILDDWKLSPATAADSLLVISELFTNAIIHTLPPAALRLSWTEVDGDSALRIEVTDAGPADPSRRPADGDDPDEHGRGIGIITALSARCGVNTHSGGITRWADVLAA